MGRHEKIPLMLPFVLLDSVVMQYNNYSPMLILSIGLYEIIR